MNKLAFLNRIALTFILAVTSVISWADEPLELKKIADLNEFYLYDGSTVTLSYTVEDENYDDVDEEYYHSIITDKDGNNVLPASLSAKGKYTLTIIGDTTNYTGILTASFYIWDTTLDGAGTEPDPYMIYNEDDWIKLSALLYLTHDTVTNPTEGKYFQLGDDISVETMTGKYSIPFMGTFDGDNKTLTFNKGSYGKRFDDEWNPYCAPFRYTDGASIHDLVVNGSIYTKVGGAAGLIGWNVGDVTEVEDVVVSVNIHNDEDYFYDAGVAAVGSSVRFINCIYNGFLSSFSWGGGFTPYGNEYTYVENCLFNPDPNSRSWGENFVSYDDWGDHEDPFAYPENIVDCYYTMQTSLSYNWGDSLSTQGTKVYVDDVPEGEIGCYLKKIKGFSVYTPVTVSITGVLDEYVYTGSAISIIPTVTYNGASASGHYTVSFMDSYGVIVDEVKEIGDYTMTITATDGYLGSKTKAFSVYSDVYGTWSDLQSMLSNNTIDTVRLDRNYRAGSGDAILTINRNVCIELNGYTIDRHLSEAVANGQVLKINGNKKVTITGPGVITGGYNREASGSIDGGGIVNLGLLTLKKVTVHGNNCIKKDPTSTSATARGGGIYSGKNSKLYVYGCVIRDNHAQGGAGGIFVSEATKFIVDKLVDGDDDIQTTVRSNASLDKGGGIRVRSCDTAIIRNTVISYNVLTNSSSESAANGGGIHLDNNTLTLENCVIRNNTASKFGGGIYMLKGTINAKDCTINYNASYDENKLFNSRGGGVYIYDGTFNMDGGTIYGNSSNLANGGGVFVNNGKIFNVKGNVQITGNWKFTNGSGSTQPTNVYIAGTSSKINIVGNISSSLIGIAKNGGKGVFTNGLSGNGTVDNFTSDDNIYEISSATGDEAQLTVPTPWNPVKPGEYVINNTVIINTHITNVTKITFGENGKAVVVDGGYLETVVENNDPSRLVIYGGQFVPKDAGVMATMRKDIHWASTVSHPGTYWYLISSGIKNPNLISNTNLILVEDEYPQYDLYRFNESVVKQWENYRETEIVHTPFTALDNGRGYLYRNNNDYTISISGELNYDDVDSYELSYHATVNSEDNIFKGFNIIGNPYSHNIKKGDGEAIPNTLLEEKYYVLTEDSEWILTDDGTEIEPMTGILVQAKSTANGETLTISEVPVAPSSGSKGVRASYDNIWFAVSNSKYIDKACVTFKDGRGLNKIAHENEKAPLLYIHHDDEDFASVNLSRDVKEISLNFEAMTIGKYTLSCNANGEYGYLHLIDRLTGDDIDLLADNEYSFIGTPSDKADRFVVRLDNSVSLENSAFAYQSGDEIVVRGEGELQVFDVTGRLVSTTTVNGVRTMNGSSLMTGVYIFRLVGNETKTQKVILR